MTRSRVLQWLDLQVRCHRCGCSVTGRLAFDRLTVADSVGFMLFNEGIVCDTCLKSRQ